MTVYLFLNLYVNMIIFYPFLSAALPKVRLLNCLKYYTATQRRILPAALREYSYVSYRLLLFRQPSSCVAACSQRGYRYAGITFYFWCHCGHKLDEFESHPTNRCMACQGDRAFKCGLNDTIAVYEAVHGKCSIFQGEDCDSVQL